MPTTGAHGIIIPDPSTSAAVVNQIRDLAMQVEAGLSDVTIEAGGSEAIQVGGTAPADGWWVDSGSVGGSAPATIPGKVTGLTATNVNGTIDLTWSAPADGGAPITDYAIRHRTLGGAWETYTDGVSTLTSSPLTGLPNGTPREFAVAAINAVGTGAWSDPAPATPETDPNLYVSDNFDRADADLLGQTATTGQTWGKAASGGSAGRIRSLQLESVSNTFALIDAGQADTYVQIDTVTPQAGAMATVKPGVVARSNAAGDTYYSVDTTTSTNIRIVRCVAGTVTVLSTITTTATAWGDRLGIKVVEGAGSTTITAFHKGAAVGTPVDDSTAGRPTGTYVGFKGSTNYGKFDNFSATNPAV